LNTDSFISLKHTREIIEKWRNDYNEVRPHSSLNHRTSKEYAYTKAGFSHEVLLNVGKGHVQPILPSQIPTNIGSFLLDKSPNALFCLAQQGLGYELLSDDGCINLDGLPPNNDFPSTIFYIQTNIEIGDDQNPDSFSEDVFTKFEAMLRLFQKGGICVRRVFGQGIILNDTDFNWGICTDFEQIPIKPQIKTVYPRKIYQFDDETIVNYKVFFSKYWPIISNKPEPIWGSLYRFSLSYERRTLRERMAELMLAMEPIFGDYKPQFTEIASNFSQSICAPNLIPDQIKEFLNDLFSRRKQILYDEGWENDPRNIDCADQLEDLLREAITKLLGDASNHS